MKTFRLILASMNSWISMEDDRTLLWFPPVNFAFRSLILSSFWHIHITFAVWTLNIFLTAGRIRIMIKKTEVINEACIHTFWQFLLKRGTFYGDGGEENLYGGGYRGASGRRTGRIDRRGDVYDGITSAYASGSVDMVVGQDKQIYFG